MRNRARYATTFLFLAAGPALLWGQSASTGTSAYKIGVINIQQAIANTAEGKKAFADLRKKYEPRQADLQKQQQEVENLRDQLRRQATTLSEAESQRLTRELAEKQKLYDRATEDAQADFQDDRQDVIARVGQKMVRIIDEYAKENGYAIVLDSQIPIYGGSQASTAQLPIYYAGQSVDISEDIVKRYDAQFPADSAGSSEHGASPATPAASPKPQAPSKPTARPPG